MFCFIYMKRLFVLTLFCLIFGLAKSEKSGLDHIKGCQSVGLRGGVGTKNTFNVGITYTYCFSNKLSLTVGLDHEEAVFGHSEFTSLLQLSPALEANVWNPANWFYLSIGGGGAVGYDRWRCEELAAEKKGFVFGPNVGVGFEFVPVSFLSLMLKAQQYAMFGNGVQYLKPQFTFAVRYNFHL